MVMRSAQTPQTWLLSLMPVLGPISPTETLACSRGEAVHPGRRACSQHTNLASGRRHRVTGWPVPRAGYVARLTAAAERLPASAYLAPDEFKVLKRPAPDVHRQRSAYPKESSRSVPPHHGLPIQRPHRNLRPLCLSLEYSCPLCHSRSPLTSSFYSFVGRVAEGKEHRHHPPSPVAVAGLPTDFGPASTSDSGSALFGLSCLLRQPPHSSPVTTAPQPALYTTDLRRPLTSYAFAVFQSWPGARPSFTKASGIASLARAPNPTLYEPCRVLVTRRILVINKQSHSWR